MDEGGRSSLRAVKLRPLNIGCWGTSISYCRTRLCPLVLHTSGMVWVSWLLLDLLDSAHCVLCFCLDVLIRHFQILLKREPYRIGILAHPRWGFVVIGDAPQLISHAVELT